MSTTGIHILYMLLVSRVYIAETKLNYIFASHDYTVLELWFCHYQVNMIDHSLYNTSKILTSCIKQCVYEFLWPTVSGAAKTKK